MVTFSNNVEPANGFLLRYLHRKAVEAYQEKEQDSAQLQALLRVLDWVPQLWYHLHTFLEKHSTSDFLIGKRQRTHGRGTGAATGPGAGNRLTGHFASLRPLLLPVVSSISGRVQAVVH